MNPTLMNLLIEITQENPDAAKRFIEEYYSVLNKENDTPYFLQRKLEHQRDMSYISAWFKNREFSHSNRRFIRSLMQSNIYLRKSIATRQDKWIPFLSKISKLDDTELDRLSMNLWIIQSEFGIDEIEISDLIEALGTSIVMDDKGKPTYWDKMYTDGVIENATGRISSVPQETGYECRIVLDNASFVTWTRHSIDSAALNKDKRFLYLRDLNFDINNLNFLHETSPEFEFAEDVQTVFDDHRQYVKKRPTSSFDLSDNLPRIKGQNPSRLYK